ncbi:MAG: ABC transporter ATP-binding protein [Patescibacteria group bacterium]
MQAEKKKIAPPKTVLRTYWAYVRQHRLLLSAVLATGVAMQVVSLLAPWYMRQFFNTLALQHPSAAAAAVLLSTLWIIGALWVADRLLRRLQDSANVYLQAGIMTELYEHSFGYLLGHSYNFFISNFAGSLTHRISRYTRAFETIADNILIQFLPTALFVVGAVVVLFMRNVWLGSALAVWCIFFVWFQIFIAKVRQPLRAARSEADTRVTGALADAVSNQSTITLFSGTQFESLRLKEVVADWRAKTLRNWLVDGWMWFAIGLFVVAIQVGLLWGAIVFWQKGQLTLGDFVLIQSYLLTVFNQLMGIGFNLRRFYDAFADAGEMVEILNIPHGVKNIRGAKPLEVAKGEVWFDNVNFWFNSKKTQLLKDFNLTIAGGEKVALVGPSGAGKSTITKLLLRLYDIPEGEIKIDKQNIAEVTQESLRQSIGFVPQEPVLFHRTLMENIRYGRREATDQEVIEAAKRAHCHEFISQLPQGYDTYVGERGIKLSGGERQRVAIARAILKDAPILVLDEATSSLDSESEALIQDALEELMKQKTVLVIAHRLSTIMKMDRIVVMERGALVAQGTHLELIRERGLYQKLWSIQAGGFLGDGAKPAGVDEDIVDEVIDPLAEEVTDK